MLDEIRKKLAGGAIGVVITVLVWFGQTTLATKATSDLHETQIKTQTALIQRASERVESLERLTTRVVVVQEQTQRVLDRLESRVEGDAERRRR